MGKLPSVKGWKCCLLTSLHSSVCFIKRFDCLAPGIIFIALIHTRHKIDTTSTSYKVAPSAATAAAAAAAAVLLLYCCCTAVVSGVLVVC